MDRPIPPPVDVRALRERARKHLEEGAVTPGVDVDVEESVHRLNDALATELVCVLRYWYHALAAQGINSVAVRREFLEHAREEQGHAMRIAERINQLGGKPDFNPEHAARRAHSEYVEGADLVDMIREDLIAERIAIESYRELVRYFGDRDPTSRRMMEKILANEEEHANELHDLLVAHEGRPMLPH